MPLRDTNPDDHQTMALQALVWTLAEPSRAARLLDTTGLEPTELKARAGEPAVLAATLMFLEAHEPDLIACAESTGHSPESLVAARQVLEQTR